MFPPVSLALPESGVPRRLVGLVVFPHGKALGCRSAETSLTKAKQNMAPVLLRHTPCSVCLQTWVPEQHHSGSVPVLHFHSPQVVGLPGEPRQLKVGAEEAYSYCGFV